MMPSPEVESFLTEVSPAAPAGEDLGLTNELRELRKAASGKPQTQFSEAVPPNWRDVEERAAKLMERSRDLRVAIYLTEAWTASDGFSGLARGLDLVHQLLERFWDTVHPQLDAEDSNDPTLRSNALANLASRTGLVRTVRNTPMVRSRTFGPITPRQYELVNGVIQPAEGEQPPDAATLAAGFTDAGHAAVAEALASVQSAQHSIREIERVFAERARADQGPDLEALKAVLTGVQYVVGAEAARLAPAGSEESVPGAGEGGVAPAPVRGTFGGGGPIRGREDVTRMIDEICRWYAGNEPSSPVPILLRRAKRLVAKDFMEIVRDLAPGGVEQIEKIRGEGSDD